MRKSNEEYTCTRKCNILLCYCPTKYIVKYHIISRESKETFSKILSIYFNIGGIFRGRYSLLKFNIRYILILATFFRTSNLYSCILIEPSLSRRLIPRSLSPSDKNTFPLHNVISGVHISAVSLLKLNWKLKSRSVNYLSINVLGLRKWVVCPVIPLLNHITSALYNFIPEVAK